MDGEVVNVPGSKDKELGYEGLAARGLVSYQLLYVAHWQRFGCRGRVLIVCRWGSAVSMMACIFVLSVNVFDILNNVEGWRILVALRLCMRAGDVGDELHGDSIATVRACVIDVVGSM